MISFIALTMSCSGDDEVSTLSISDYVSDNNLTTQKSPTGLNYIIHNPGVAPFPTEISVVTVNYKGYFLNDDVFDEGDNISFPLNGVIRGWTEGLQLIGAGGSITLLIPSNLAYGPGGAGSIPANTNLAFDVDLLEVVQ